MNEWVDAAKKMKDGHDKYNAIKGNIEKVEGAIADIHKLQQFVLHLTYHPSAKSSSVLLDLSYEAVTRLAGRLPTPYLSHYLKFYQSGINAISDLWRATNEAKLAKDFSRSLHKSATEFEDAINALVYEYSYAGAMVDFNGKPSVNLPAGLKGYLKRTAEFEESMVTVGNSIRQVNWMKPLQALETVHFHGEYAAGKGADLFSRKRGLSLGIVYQARYIAAANMNFSLTFSKITSAGDLASATMKRLASSSNPANAIAGSSAEKSMLWDLYDREVTTHASGINHEDLDKFANGDWKGMRDYKKMKTAMQDMRALSSKWASWADLAAKGRFMEGY